MTKYPGGFSRRAFLDSMLHGDTVSSTDEPTPESDDFESVLVIGEVEVSAAEFLERPTHWVSKAGRSQWLALKEGADHLEDLLNCRELARAHRLSLFKADLQDEGLARLIKLLAGGRTIALRLHENEIGDDGLIHLIESPLFDQLTDLDLFWNDINVASVERLVAVRDCRLRHLDLAANDFASTGAQLLAAWPLLDQLTELSVGYSEIADAGTAALAESPYLAKLKRLDLAGSGIRAAGAQALIGSSAIGPETNLFLDNLVANTQLLGAEYRNIIPQHLRTQLYERYGQRLVLDYYLGETSDSVNRVYSLLGIDTGETPDPDEPGVISVS